MIADSLIKEECDSESESESESEFDSATKIVKKEEDSFLKMEEDSSQYSYMESYINPLTVPWRRSSFFAIKPLKYPEDSFHFRQTQNFRPFSIIKEPKPEREIKQNVISITINKTIINVKVDCPIKKKKQPPSRPSRCKNYVGLLCAGFSRVVLKAERSSDLFKFVHNMITEKKKKLEALKNIENNKLIHYFKNYIHENMSGKKVRTAHRERDFKIINVTDLQGLFTILDDDDDEWKRLTKEVLKRTMEYFFESVYYNQWLENGMMTPPNRSFFQINREEIQKKFLNPGSYKPKFKRINSS